MNVFNYLNIYLNIHFKENETNTYYDNYVWLNEKTHVIKK